MWKPSAKPRAECCALLTWACRLVERISTELNIVPWLTMQYRIGNHSNIVNWQSFSPYNILSVIIPNLSTLLKCFLGILVVVGLTSLLFTHQWDVISLKDCSFTFNSCLNYSWKTLFSFIPRGGNLYILSTTCSLNCWLCVIFFGLWFSNSSFGIRVLEVGKDLILYCKHYI